VSQQRLFKAQDFMQPSPGEPIRSVVVESTQSVVVAWHVLPGQSIAPHTHPAGQDTWTILAGRGRYQVDASGATIDIEPGDILVAMQDQVHGVTCTSEVPLQFVSVVAPAEAGYVPLASQL
jgi:quercetin dioxygenase-like cupin family protein